MKCTIFTIMKNFPCVSTCIRKNWCQKLFPRKITGLYKCTDSYVISSMVTLYTATSMEDAGVFFSVSRYLFNIFGNSFKCLFFVTVRNKAVTFRHECS